MTESFEAILHSYGRPVTLRRGDEERTLRAFVQRIRGRRGDVPRQETPFGADDLRRWLYIGPAAQEIEVGDRVQDGEDAYLVQNAAAVYVGGERSHWWAILRPVREAFA